MWKDAFLSPRISGVVIRARDKQKRLYAQLNRINEHARLLQLQIEVAPEDVQGLLIAIFFSRTLNSIQAAVLVGERGLPAQAKVLLRASMESMFSLRACLDPEFAEKLNNADPVQRKKHYKKAAQLVERKVISDPNGVVSPEKLAEIEADIAEVNARDITTAEIGMGETVTLGRSEWPPRQEEIDALMAEELPPPPAFQESLADLTTRVATLVGKVPPPRPLKQPHRAIARLLEADAARLQAWRTAAYPSVLDQPYFISPYEQRRLRILNGIILTMARLGMPSSLQGKNPADIVVQVGATRVTFRLDHPGAQRESWRPTSEPRRPASDALHLTIPWETHAVDGLRLAWEDAPDAPIEQSLRDIVIGLIVAGEMQVRLCELQHHAWRVKHKADLIEKARKEKEEAQRRERERCRRLEQARIERLLEEAMTLRLADDLRAYVEAVTNANSVSPEPLPSPQMEAWATWALAQAERIDPVRSRAFLKTVEDEAAEDPGEAEPPVMKSPAIPSARVAAPDPPVKPPWHPGLWYTRLSHR